MKIAHAPQPEWEDSEETGVVQPSDVVGMEHTVLDEGVFEAAAGAPISALTVVWEDEDGAVWPLDYRDGAHIHLLAGMSLTSAAAAGEALKLQRAGLADVSGLGLVQGCVWLGAGGAPTQTPPADGYDVRIGCASARGQIYLDFSEPIRL